jgi:hypothetical protein
MPKGVLVPPGSTFRARAWNSLGAGALTPRRRMARIWNMPFFILATVYFIVDGVFSYATQPVTAWIPKKNRSSERELG